MQTLLTDFGPVGLLALPLLMSVCQEAGASLPRITHRKVGGIRFLACGRVRISFCRVRA